MINSRRKGAGGGRSFRDLLRAAGFTARRGQQYRGGPDSPDVICEELPIHFEVKSGRTHSLTEAYRKAIVECPPGKIPVVGSRRDRGKWMVYLSGEDFLDIVRRSDLPLPRVHSEESP